MQLTRRGAAQLTSLAVFSSLALAGCNHAGSSDTGSGGALSSAGDTGAVATLTTPKGATLTVTQPEFYSQLQTYVPNTTPSQAAPQGNYAPPGAQAGRLVLNQMLQSLMVEGLAQDEGVAPTDAEVNTQYNNIKMIQDAQNIKGFDQALQDAGLSSDLFKEMQVKPQLARLKLLTKGVTVSDADIQTFYNANKEKFTKPARVHIKRIVVRSLAEAQAIAKAIQGGQTFESQASQSLDKSSPDGDVPQWVPLDPAPPSLASVIKPIKTTPPGQVTPPITLPGPNGQNTFWLVKVVEKKDKEVLPIDQLKDLIRANLLQQKAQSPEGLQQQLRDFQTGAKIAISSPQYASLAQELTHPAPPPPSAPFGGSPFAPGGKP